MYTIHGAHDSCVTYKYIYILTEDLLYLTLHLNTYDIAHHKQEREEVYFYPRHTSRKFTSNGT